uniref:Uncharacterized protein n=1 Tax=Sphaerodactylus townsendi TaxID=933632 RepID=A0ACB8E8R3_9SAUR
MSDRGADSMMDGAAQMLSCDGREEGSPGSTAARSKVGRPHEIVWRNVILMTLLHATAGYSLVLIPKSHVFTLIWGKVMEARASPPFDRFDRLE